MISSNQKTMTMKSTNKETAEKLDLADLSANYQFVVPDELTFNGLGLISCLMNKQLIDLSFSKLYELSSNHGWKKVFAQERQKLKPNENSVLKCFLLNRLSFEQSQNPSQFNQRIQDVNDEINQRMRAEFPPGWTSEDLYDQVRYWQDIQCRRRLFYFNHAESRPLASFLMLHKAASNWCYCLINHCRKNKTFWKNEGRQRLIEHLQHSFIIVAQPTGSEGTAVTQYTKSNAGHSARLHCRIICLLDPVLLKDYINLSDIEVTLQPLNREMKEKIEKQPDLKWRCRTISSSEGLPISITYAEISNVQLEKFDSNCKRLLLNSTLCQLEFRLNIQVENPSFEGFITLTSQPFGICSHAQYFPKYLAKIFLYEMNQILKNNERLLEPALLTEFVGRYHMRIAGIAPNDYTSRYIRQLFQYALEEVNNSRVNMTLESTYEEILAKLIHQMDIYVLYPVLSMMYEDRLFLGICHNNEMDQMLRGTRERPQMLLRLNALVLHQYCDPTTVQLIIHDGSLKRASFDMKTFANEMCRFICESISEHVKPASVLSPKSSRSFRDFQSYFDTELYRLNKMLPPSGDVYDPLLPILWMTMRSYSTNESMSNSSEKRKRVRSNSPSSRVASSSINVAETTDYSHRKRDKREFVLEIPSHVNVSVELLQRYLQSLPSIESNGPTIEINVDTQMKYSSNSISTTMDQRFPCDILTTIPHQIEIKREAEDYSD